MEAAMDLSVAATKDQTAQTDGGPAAATGCPTMWRCDLPGVTVRLENAELWQEFHNLGTEMIITKNGRRMFPSLQFCISGLDPAESYVVMLEHVSASMHRYRYNSNAWCEAGSSEQDLVPMPHIYMHPDSPAKGAYWMREPLSLHKAKITNNPADENGHLVLLSMHKYLPRVMVVKTTDVHVALWSPMCMFSFPETEFIAVTAYQNKKITNLKINTNPFAKGFREGGQSNNKRKSDKDASSGITEVQQPQQRCCSAQSSEHSAEDSGCMSAGPCSPALDDSKITVISQNEVALHDPRLHYVPCMYPPQDLWRFPICHIPTPLLLHGPWGSCPLLPRTLLTMSAWNNQALNSTLHEKGYAPTSS